MKRRCLLTAHYMERTAGKTGLFIQNASLAMAASSNVSQLKKPDAHRRGQRAVGNRQRARHAAEQDRRGQRAAQRHLDPAAALTPPPRRRRTRRTTGRSSTPRSEEHTSELQSLMRNSYAVFCLKKKKKYTKAQQQNTT